MRRQNFVTKKLKGQNTQTNSVYEKVYAYLYNWLFLTMT